MPRPLRIEYPGTIYHLMSWGTTGDPKKTPWALRLREETPMTRQWIATRLGMGSASYLSHLSVKGKDYRL